MDLIRIKEVRLTRKSGEVIAVLGFDPAGDCRGEGPTVAGALRGLAAEISVWVFPIGEEVRGFARVIAFACDEWRGRRRC